ncbi:MAG TPA: ImmA/IrrE family metallo-endopeptidase, partial [Terriglobales bacterium]|nr:ImmA/IrrE family metallo-endopeptidase [Terriglobales bacterium]
HLAREKRADYGVDTGSFGLREVRAIYKQEGIRIDYWRLPRKIKALYMCDDGDCSVALQRTIPYEPKLFALIHELKHHYRDRAALGASVIHCGDYDANELIEKGAEVFAAEFIYPQAEFADDLENLGLAVRQASDVVEFKRSCKAKVSYRFICKRLERLGQISPGQFDGMQFQKLEEKLYGVPFYRRRR